MLPENGFDVVAVRIKNESSIISRRIAARSKARSAVVRAASSDSCRVKSINLLPAYSSDGRMLLGSMRMEDIDPEHGIVDAITHAAQLWTFIVGQFEVPRNPNHDLNAKGTQRSFVEPG